MQIYLDLKDFKALYEDLVNCDCYLDSDTNRIIEKELKPQYEEAFLKYKDQKQKFKVRDKVQIKCNWPEGIVWYDGTISKVMRLANGQYKYIIRYIEDKDICHTNPLTEKNIRKNL